MVVRPKVRFNESLQSYIIRACRGNNWRYEGFKAYVTKHVAPLHSTKPDARDKIKAYFQSITGFKDVSELIDVWELAGKHRGYFDMARQKICPICYEQGYEAPAYWSLNSYTACVKHEVLMIDTCHSCGERFTHDTLINHKCSNCGTCIFDSPSESVIVDEYSKKILSLFSDASLCQEQYLTLTDTEVATQEFELSLLKSLTTNFSRDMDTSKRHARRNSTIGELHQKQLECGAIFASKQLLNRDVKNAVEEVYQRGERDFGSIIQAIKIHILDPKAEFLVEALQAFLISSTDECAELKVGLKLVEQLFGIESGKLISYVTKNYPESVIVAPGAPSVKAHEIKNLLHL